MELKVSSIKAGLSPSDYTSDPEEKETSEGEDEDDDRNHKHRRHESRSQSLEENSLDQGLTRPYRKRSRPAENGNPQSGEIWKPVGSDRGASSRFEKRRPNQTPFSRAPLELNQRTRGSQTMPSEVGLVRGRGRKPISWGVHDSRLGLVDVASPLIQPGPVPSALFAGRGFQNVSSVQSTSWNAFGLVPGVPNYGLDSLHHLGMQATMRPAMSPIINIGIPRQRCRDFEERGFCLRGDMCPMEHGVNRIVVEDVQGLSQYNLPVSVTGSQLPGTSSVQGALPVITASDLYDPDQPLWANDKTETAAAPLNQSNVDETVPISDANHHDRQKVKSRRGFNPESPSSSMWGRLGSAKPVLGVNDNKDSARPSSAYGEQNIKSEDTLTTVLPNVSHQGNGSLPMQSSLKAHNDPLQNTQKQPQKPLSTLFVNGIPLKDNGRDSLISHFQKFGEVIDIHIPMHSERAFVQFSKREEAEAALKAPDAVMGNRFIKLWWAKRDNISDDPKNGNYSVPVIPHKMNALNPSLPHPSVLDKGKETPQPKPLVTAGPKPPPPQQKKLESLELLKEQLRKKQEMLEQKRNEFKRQLDKLEKHGVGSKDDPTMKSPKGETQPDYTKVETTQPDRTKAETSTKLMNSVSTVKAAIVEPSVPISNPSVAVQEPMRPSFRPPGTPFVANRYKLDNRPTAFKIVPPLPPGLANVAALKEHFSDYGEISSVEVEESSSSACVSFATRRAAEKAFLQGKSWKGQALQLMWLTSNANNSNVQEKNPSSPQKTDPTETEHQTNTRSNPDHEGEQKEE